jgi:hypothetical protein
MIGGAPGQKYRLWSPEKAARLSSWLPGTDVPGTRDGFSWCCHLFLFRLAVKPCGGDVDGLAYRLHQPTNYSWQARVHSPLTGVIPSRRTV